MKSFVIFSLCLVAMVYADAESLKKDMKEKGKECGEELGVTESQIEEWKQKKDEMTDEDKHKAACLATCVFKKLHMMDDNGLIMDEIMKKVDDLHKDDADNEKLEKMKSAVTKCSEEVSGETDTCDKGGKFLKCVMKSIKHHHHHGDHASSEEQKSE